MARTIAKDHDAKRLHILKTAARAFADAGIARTSMAQIAMACGISKANIYHYYSGKDALLFDILDTYLSELRDVLCRLKTTADSPDVQLENFARAALRAYDGMDAEHKIQSEGLPLLPTEQQRILKSYQRDMVASLSETLMLIASTPFADDPQKLRATTMSVFGMLNWFYMWNSNADAAARDAYAKLVAQLTIDGIRGM